MAAVSPIPKIVTTPIKEDFSREEEDCRDEWGKSESGIKVETCDRPSGKQRPDITFNQIHPVNVRVRTSSARKSTDRLVKDAVKTRYLESPVNYGVLLVFSTRFSAKAGAETAGPGVDTHQARAERRSAGPRLLRLLRVGVRDRQPGQPVGQQLRPSRRPLPDLQVLQSGGPDG